MSLELSRILQVLAKCSVVVDFTIDGEQDLSIIRGERLSTSVYADDS